MINTKNIIDISWPISEQITSWKNGKPVKFQSDATWEKNKSRSTTIHLNVHTGTHIDAPSHFLEKGDTSEKVSLQKLIGRCLVFDFTSLSVPISKDDFAEYDSLIQPGDIVLCKTRNSFLNPTDSFDFKFISVDMKAAQYLVDKKVNAVGIDYLGIERSDIQKNHETHTILLSAGVVIVEGLRLANVECVKKDTKKGIYTFICLPIKLVGLDGALARAILIPHE